MTVRLARSLHASVMTNVHVYRRCLSGKRLHAASYKNSFGRTLARTMFTERAFEIVGSGERPHSDVSDDDNACRSPICSNTSAFGTVNDEDIDSQDFLPDEDARYVRPRKDYFPPCPFTPVSSLADETHPLFSLSMVKDWKWKNQTELKKLINNVHTDTIDELLSLITCFVRELQRLVQRKDANTDKRALLHLVDSFLGLLQNNHRLVKRVDNFSYVNFYLLLSDIFLSMPGWGPSHIDPILLRLNVLATFLLPKHIMFCWLNVMCAGMLPTTVPGDPDQTLKIVSFMRVVSGMPLPTAFLNSHPSCFYSSSFIDALFFSLNSMAVLSSKYPLYEAFMILKDKELLAKGLFLSREVRLNVLNRLYYRHEAKNMSSFLHFLLEEAKAPKEATLIIGKENLLSSITHSIESSLVRHFSSTENGDIYADDERVDQLVNYALEMYSSDGSPFIADLLVKILNLVAYKTAYITAKKKRNIWKFPYEAAISLVIKKAKISPSSDKNIERGILVYMLSMARALAPSLALASASNGTLAPVASLCAWLSLPSTNLPLPADIRGDSNLDVLFDMYHFFNISFVFISQLPQDVPIRRPLLESIFRASCKGARIGSSGHSILSFLFSKFPFLLQKSAPGRDDTWDATSQRERQANFCISNIPRYRRLGDIMAGFRPFLSEILWLIEDDRHLEGGAEAEREELENVKALSRVALYLVRHLNSQAKSLQRGERDTTGAKKWECTLADMDIHGRILAIYYLVLKRLFSSGSCPILMSHRQKFMSTRAYLSMNIPGLDVHQQCSSDSFFLSEEDKRELVGKYSDWLFFFVNSDTIFMAVRAMAYFHDWRELSWFLHVCKSFGGDANAKDDNDQGGEHVDIAKVLDNILQMLSLTFPTEISVPLVSMIPLDRVLEIHHNNKEDVFVVMEKVKKHCGPSPLSPALCHLRMVDRQIFASLSAAQRRILEGIARPDPPVTHLRTQILKMVVD